MTIPVALTTTSSEDCAIVCSHDGTLDFITFSPDCDFIILHEVTDPSKVGSFNPILQIDSSDFPSEITPYQFTITVTIYPDG